MNLLTYLKDIKTPLFVVLIFLQGTLLWNSCAKVGSPTGGPKDTIPPHIVKTKPLNFSTNIYPTKISITFDEFIQLQDERSEFVISPYIEEPVFPIVAGKNINIDLKKAKLDSSMTYTFDFGKSIVDNNEKNEFSDFRFVFSPKDYIDSMSIGGKIINASDLLPRKEGFNIYLYQNLHDSMPTTTPPDYLAKADNEGNFYFSNIKNGEYRLFALVDENVNMYYDLPSEPIAFLDHTINVESFTEYRWDYFYTDTTFVDSLNDGSIDTLFIDTLIFNQQQVTLLQTPDSLLTDSLQIVYDSIIPASYWLDSSLVVINDYVADLFYFVEEVNNQLLNDYSLEDKRYLKFEFEEPLADSLLSIELLYPQAGPNWHLKEHDKTQKIYSFWIPDTALGNADSISVLLKYPLPDSNQILYTKFDTLIFFERVADEKETRDNNRRRFGAFGEKEEIDTLPVKDTIITPRISISSNLKRNNFDLDQAIKYTCKTPYKTIASEKIKLYYMEDDTIPVETDFVFRKDADDLRNFYIEKEWEESSTYKIFIPERAIDDIYGAINDTIEFSFSTQSLDFYGTLNLNISEVYDYSIIQFMDDKETVLQEFYIESDTVINLKFLKPATYMLKGIFDTNRNKKWDTGDYETKRQPETVVYYNGEANVRANWEMELFWYLSDHERKAQKEKDKKNNANQRNSNNTRM